MPAEAKALKTTPVSRRLVAEVRPRAPETIPSSSVVATRAGEGCGRNRGVRQPDARAEREHGDPAERGAAGDAEHERIGERVAQQRLEQHAGDGQRGADQQREHDAREPHAQHDVGGRALRVGREQRRHHLARRERARTGRQSDDDRAEHRERRAARARSRRAARSAPSRVAPFGGRRSRSGRRRSSRRDRRRPGRGSELAGWIAPPAARARARDRDRGGSPRTRGCAARAAPPPPGSDGQRAQ